MKIRTLLPAKSEVALHCAQINLDQSAKEMNQIEKREQAHAHTVEVFQAFSLGTEGVDVVDIDENSAMDNSSKADLRSNLIQ